MCDRYLEILKESAHKGNYIPSGRQLHRTPPLPDVKRHLNFCSDSSLDLEEQQQRNVEVHMQRCVLTHCPSLSNCVKSVCFLTASESKQPQQHV